MSKEFLQYKTMLDVNRKQQEILLRQEEEIQFKLSSAFSDYCEKLSSDGYFETVNIRGDGHYHSFRLHKNSKVMVILNCIGKVEFYAKKLWNTNVYYENLNDLIDQGVSEKEIADLRKSFKDVCEA